MFKPDKIASVYRKSSNTLVKYKEEKDYWIVSDTYSFFILTPEEYVEFISKYNSYKSTKNIPLQATAYSVQTQNDKVPNFDLVIPDISRRMTLEVTELHWKDSNILKAENGKLVALDEKYIKLIPESNVDWDWNYIADETTAKLFLSPIKVECGNLMKALIMPVRCGDAGSPKEAIEEVIN